MLALDPEREGFPELTEGAEVPVFVPPQGGVFTELDLLLQGFEVDEVVRVRVTVDQLDGDLLANQTYQGVGLPLACLGDGTVYARRMPVGFADGLELAELEGVDAELALTVFAPGTQHDHRWGVTLRVTGY